MGWIDTSWDYNTKRRIMRVRPYKTDLNTFKVVKIRQSKTCNTCNKKIPKKSYAYGSDWVRLCLNCGEAFSKKAIKEIEKVVQDIKDSIKYSQENREKWDAENIVALL